jgi:hypothetical protein
MILFKTKMEKNKINKLKILINQMKIPMNKNKKIKNYFMNQMNLMNNNLQKNLLKYKIKI